MRFSTASWPLIRGRSLYACERASVSLSCGRPPRLMSALGQKQTCAAQKVMSALPPKADMCGATRDVRFVPKADIRRGYSSMRLSARKQEISANRQSNADDVTVVEIAATTHANIAPKR